MSYFKHIGPEIQYTMYNTQYNQLFQTHKTTPRIINPKTVESEG